MLLVVGLCVAGCGSAGSARVGRVSGGAGRGSQAKPVGSAPYTVVLTQFTPNRHTLLPIGSAQQVYSRGAALSVTVRAVIDSLKGAGAVLQKGTRAVGVMVQIANAGPAVYDSSATGDFTIVTSSGPVTPLLAKRGVCKTPVDDFDRDITAGEDRVGCVAFAVPIGATVTEVRFSPHAEAKGRLVWAG